MVVLASSGYSNQQVANEIVFIRECYLTGLIAHRRWYQRAQPTQMDGLPMRVCSFESATSLGCSIIRGGIIELHSLKSGYYRGDSEVMAANFSSHWYH
jgi:hypothetical protein